MKLYLSHSTGYDYKSELYEPLRRVFAQDHDIFFPHDNHEHGVKSKDVIASSDVILAEVSLPSTGQGIELGWADTYDKPIVCFYREGSKISSALSFISNTLLEYASQDDMIGKLQEKIQEL